MAMILVTHDLGVVAGRTDDIAVMYAGKIVEQAPTSVLFAKMKMPYTEALVSSIPKLENPSHTRARDHPPAGRPTWCNPPRGCGFAPRCKYVQDKCREEEPPLAEAETARPPLPLLVPGRTRPEGRDALARNLAAIAAEPRPRPTPPPRVRRHHQPTPPRRRHGGQGELRWPEAAPPTCATPGETLLRAENLVVEFPVGSTGLKVHAVTDVSIDVREGETLGLVGESGCGKSTTGRALMQLPQPTSGLGRLRRARTSPSSRATPLRQLRPEMQMIFQDPISSLNPRRKVGDIVAEPLQHLEAGHRRRAAPGRRRDARGRRPRPRGRRRPPAPPVLRRPVPAHLHRPVAGARPQAHHLRRAGVGPRRVGAGPDPQPARGHEGALRPHARVHRPRPGRGEEHQRPGRGDVPRQAVRGRQARRPLRQAGPPLHRRAAQLDPGARPDGAAQGGRHPRRRAALAASPRRAAAGSAPAARRRRTCAPQAEPKMRQVGLGHYVACHFPLDVGEKTDRRRNPVPDRPIRPDVPTLAHRKAGAREWHPATQDPARS